MLFSFKDRENLEKLNKLVSLVKLVKLVISQVKLVRLQDELGKQIFHEDMKKVFELVTKSIKNVSGEVTMTITETSKNNNKAIENLNNKPLEILNDRCILAS